MKQIFINVFGLFIFASLPIGMSAVKSNKQTDTVPTTAIPIIAKKQAEKKIDSVIKSNKNEWYIKQRTWVGELKEIIVNQGITQIESSNRINKILTKLDSTQRSNDSVSRANSVIQLKYLNELREKNKEKIRANSYERTVDWSLTETNITFLLVFLIFLKIFWPEFIKGWKEAKKLKRQKHETTNAKI